MTKSNENYRNDPATREWVANQIEQKQNAIREAHRLIKEAQNVLRGVPLHNIGDPIYMTVVESVNSAYYQTNRLIGGFYMEPSTETYIGNKSAFELGVEANNQGLV